MMQSSQTGSGDNRVTNARTLSNTVMVLLYPGQ